MQEELLASTEGVQKAVRKSADELKVRLRRKTERALGEKVGKAWQSRFYPNKGMNAAGLVYTKAPKIILAHTEGALIRPKHARLLAIPTEHVPFNRNGRRLHAHEWPSHRLGKLRYIARDNGPDLLVADRLRFSKKGRLSRSKAKSKRALRKTLFLVMYVLVPQVKLRRRLNIKSDIARAARRLPDYIVQEMSNAVKT